MCIFKITLPMNLQDQSFFTQFKTFTVCVLNSTYKARYININGIPIH
jgi:hypothetical protein